MWQEIMGCFFKGILIRYFSPLISNHKQTILFLRVSPFSFLFLFSVRLNDTHIPGVFTRTVD